MYIILLNITTFFFFLVTVVINPVAAQPAYKEHGGQKNNSTTANVPFEGSIKFAQVSGKDTLYYSYEVKNRMVRLEIHEDRSNEKSMDDYMLFDLDKGKITALKPSRKIYINVAPKQYVVANDPNFKIIKSKNCKKIFNYKCYQWRVKNLEQNTEISYWVANDNFDFFDDFLRLWNRSEKHAVYFLQIPDINGYFPMVSDERTVLRDQKMKLEVIEISKKKMDDKLFQIPKDFTSYDN
jgi:hypothetical protein